MTRSLFLAALLALTTTAAAQTMPDPIKNMGQKPKRFSFDLSTKQKGGQVTWTAAKQEYVRDEYVVLEGAVKLNYQDVVMSADKLTYNFKTKDVTAEGNVIIDQGPQRIWGDRAFFNMESKTGTFFNASGSFQSSVFFSGDKIEKLDERSYRLTNGLFTSCELDDPSWSFRLRSGVVTVDDYARLRDLSFRAKRIPLLWTPYLVWPTKRDRAQGFLIPHIGYSSRFGANVSTSYFLPFGKSADTTVTADVYTQGYFGLGNETRYKPTQDINGTLRVEAINDAEDCIPGSAGCNRHLGENDDKLKWRYTYAHTQENLPGGFRGVVDVRDFSDLTFFRRFSRDFALNTLSDIYSSAYLAKNRSQYALNIRTDRRERFLGFDSATGHETSTVFEQLPSLEFRLYPNQLGSTPLYFSSESSVAHLRTSRGANYYRTDLFPTLSLQLHTPSWLSVKPQLSLRNTYYTSTQDPTTQSIEDQSMTRTYGQGQVEIVGPSFSRIFRGELGGFSRFKHIIEPRIRYLYTTSVDDQQRIIQFDTVDSPFLPLVRDTVEYSLTQRILAKPKGENTSAREIMSFSVRQTASLSEPFDRTKTFAGNNKYTPLSVTAHVNPYQSISLDANATFGNISHQLDQASVSANVLGPQGSFLALTYFTSLLAPGQTTGNSSQLRINTQAPLWRDRLQASVQLNYDAEANKLQEQRYVIGANASCYSVALEYRDFRSFRGAVLSGSTFDRTRDYQISVSLKNVGTFVDLRGSLDRKK